MGIDGLYSALRNNDILNKDVYTQATCIEAPNLFIDFTSIVHNISSKLDTDTVTDKSISEHIINNVVDYINQLKSRFTKLKFTYIALDGVPHMSKIRQQIHRRYTGAYIDYMNEYLLNTSQLSDDRMAYEKNKIKWSKNNISPATPFMNAMEKTLIISDDTHVSGIHEYGEAEKKIVDYIHKHDINNFSIYSPDADVILLSMLLWKPGNNISVIRYDQNTNEYTLININKLIDNMMSYMHIQEDKCTVIKDIIFIFTLFGDDFVPKTPASNIGHDIIRLLDIYTKLNGNHITKQDNNIDLHVMYTYVNHLAKTEDDALLVKQMSKDYYTIHKSIKNNPDNIKVHADNIRNKVYPLKKSNNTFSQYSDKFITITNNLKDKGFQITKYDIDKYKLNNLLDEYKELLNNTFTDHINIKIKKDKITHGTTKKVNDNVIYEYIKGLLWVNDYYNTYNNNQMSTWYYKCNNVPYIKDIVNYIDRCDINNITKKIYSELNSTYIDKQSYLTPEQHMLYIIPALDYIYLIPEEYHAFIRKSNIYNSIKDKAYDIFKTKNNPILFNCQDTWFISACKVNIPNIDIHTFKKAYDKYIK